MDLRVACVRKMISVRAVIVVNALTKTGVKTVNVLWKKESVPAMSVHSLAVLDCSSE